MECVGGFQFEITILIDRGEDILMTEKRDFNSYFKSIPEMQTERLILTAFSREDMPDYFDIIRDEEVQRFLGGGVPVFDEEPHVTNWLRNVNDRLLSRKLVFTWCIKEKESGKVIGRIDLGGFVRKSTAEISYHIARNFWGYGIATEAVSRITAFGTDELKLKRIQGVVRKENQASIRVLEKNGYVQEGLLHYYPFGREFHDVVILAKINI